MLILFKSSKELTSVVRSGKDQNSGYKKLKVSADHGREFNPFVDHTTKLQSFTKGENHDFSAFRYSLHLMFQQSIK